MNWLQKLLRRPRCPDCGSDKLRPYTRNLSKPGENQYWTESSMECMDCHRNRIWTPKEK